ncbi:coiled-coil and C2 domain-containing 1B isoform X1 [Pelobates cultripes]|uniref:Coiled-coil and C2 domain-containing protein 1B n=2 Tax=Pelobates cultripes TaxID=61616 RepID=A0AAD1SS81_PELCU|nr:coiled-coil and C2 domain-containing 1B isoform X1 [Pelobates cultripes]
MLGRKAGKKNAQVKGQGAAAAKQMGLFVDFNPDDMMMMGIPDDADDADLEAELAALTGAEAVSKPKSKGKAPLPMEHIEKLAQDCMRDSDGDDLEDEDLEQDEDLLAELQEVVGEEMEVEMLHPVSSLAAPDEPAEPVKPHTSPVMEQQHVSQGTGGGLLQTLEERISNYKTAISNAKLAKENTKARRYERGLKTLESMLASVRQGRAVNEEEIPPLVSTGKTADSSQAEPPESIAPQEQLVDLSISSMENTEISASQGPTGGMVAEVGTSDGQASTPADMDSRTLLLTRQGEYKVAALKAKQSGDVEKAKEYMKISKKFSAVMEALESGQPVDLSNMPPAPEEHDVKVSVPVPDDPNPTSTQGTPAVLQALQQRMEKYKSAAQQAKSAGDDRKARMHERIAKQYQDAIRAHKAGRQTNLAELPVPPGFPPLPGLEDNAGEMSVESALETAQKLANADVDEGEEDDQPEKPPVPKKPTQIVKPLSPTVPHIEETSANAKSEISIENTKPVEHLSSEGRDQLEFLENRRKQYRRAALQAKQRNDLEQAKQHMRVAHTLQVSIDQVRSGKLVDISKIPGLPLDEDNDFVVIEPEDAKPLQNSDDVYSQLLKMLQEQHEKCLRYSKQFTQMGNVTETTRFEKMAEDCKKNCSILQLSQAQGLDPPPYHFEDKTLKIVRVFSELSSTEMLLIVVRGINLPAPSGTAPNDLNAFVKFEFPYPSTEQPQKNKTSVIKNTNSPEYEQSFKLNINRNHRGFKRVVQTKGVKFEIFNKGVFLLKSDKQIGTANVKLDKLESQCEIREIVEVFDGRKQTGGKLEVKVRLREPLNGQDLQTVTEKWLVLGQIPRK